MGGEAVPLSPLALRLDTRLDSSETVCYHFELAVAYSLLYSA